MPEETKINSIKISRKGGKPNITHIIDQFPWYEQCAPKRWDKYDACYKKLPLSAIKFKLPGNGDPTLTVACDGTYRLAIYLDSDAMNKVEELASRKLDDERPEDFYVSNGGIKEDAIDLATLFTTEISPALMGSIPMQGKRIDYPLNCFRTYRMLLSPPTGEDYVDLVMDIRDEDRANETLTVRLVQDIPEVSKKLLTLKYSNNWLPEKLESMISSAAKAHA